MGLSENSIIDIAIGMSFTFFVLALFASALNEAVSSLFGLRSKSLEAWLKDNLTGAAGTGAAATAAVAAFYAHPLVRGLARSGKKPSYVASKHAITALLDVGGAAGGAAGVSAQTAGDIQRLINGLPPSPMKDGLQSAWVRAGDSVFRFRAEAEKWFDDGMDRLSGWYKRRVQLALWIFGCLIAIALNADAIQIALTLYKDPTLRHVLDAQAANLTTQPDASEASKYVANLPLPLGWGAPGRHLPYWWSWAFPLKALGLLMTSAAVALGAPFWFDTLSKLGSLRGAGRQPKSANTP